MKSGSLLLILLMMSCLNLSSCSKGAQSPDFVPPPSPPTLPPVDTQPPIIKHLGVNFGDYDPSTHKAGDFVFNDGVEAGSTGKKMVEFGGLFKWGACPGQCGISFHMIYRLPKYSPVYSPIDGIITGIEYDTNWEDYGLTIATTTNSEYFINIDHMLNLTVSIGDRVEAGDLVGEVSDSVLEIDLSNDNGNTYCMFDFFDPSTKSVWTQKVIKHMQDWEAYRGDNSIYDESSMVEPGCALHIRYP